MMKRFFLSLVSMVTALMLLAPAGVTFAAVKKHAPVKTKKTVVHTVKKTIKKKKIIRKASTKGTFSVAASEVAAAAAGKQPPPGYFAALKKAEADCVARRPNCDQETLDAQAMLTQ